MKAIYTFILILFISIPAHSQTVYSWSAGVDPGWTSSDGVLTWRGGCNAVTTNCNGNYANNTNSFYTSGSIDATCAMASTVIVSFFISGNAESGWDFLFFEYSTNGTTWTNFYGPGIGLTGNAGAGLTWSLPAIPVSATLYIRLNFQSDGSVRSSGYHITNFTIDCNVQLPVELTDFDGEYASGMNELKWTTQSEINNSHFIVDRSVDGTEFSEVAQISGAGNSSEEINYFYKDQFFEKGIINYYRLTQVDYDGVSEVFNIIAIDNRIVEKTLIGTYNLLGQPVDNSYTGIVIDHYDNGEKIKRYSHK